MSDIPLLPEQEQLLAQMVEASRGIPRDQRQKFLLINTMAGSYLIHPGLPARPKVIAEDVETLAHVGLLAVSYGSRGTPNYFVTPAGYQHYETAKRLRGGPVQQMEAEVRSFLDADAFSSAYPGAFAKWTAAVDRLWSADSAGEATTIGHLLREALQEFATALVERHDPPDAPDNPAKDVARIRSVLRSVDDRLGSAECALLDALLGYWGAVTDLAQRQEHGSQREGQPLEWEDARRLVFQVAILFFEFDRSLQRIVRR